jgi:uncharacterized damage-inducible protein DinB
MPKAPKPPVDLAQAMLGAWDTSERINQYLLENLPEEAWRAEPPGGKGRTVAAIVAHIHNVRRMWLVVAAKDSPAPDKVDRDKLTIPQARRAMKESALAMRRLLETSLATGGHVRDFKPGVVHFLGYAVAHEAHHRGQIAMLCRQAGHPLAQAVQFGMWEWGKRSCELAEAAAAQPAVGDGARKRRSAKTK